MFSTCVARGKAAKLVYKTMGGKVGPVCIAAMQQLMALRRREESALTMREGR
jgi:hypothetical protein